MASKEEGGSLRREFTTVGTKGGMGGREGRKKKRGEYDD